MSRRITQRELRNESGRIMRALDKGEAFTVTRNGVPVGELIPVRPRVFVPADAVITAYRREPRIARRRFRRDIDSAINQDPTPRGCHERGLVDTSVVIDLDVIEPQDLPRELAVSVITLAELAPGPHATRMRASGRVVRIGCNALRPPSTRVNRVRSASADKRAGIEVRNHSRFSTIRSAAVVLPRTLLTGLAGRNRRPLHATVPAFLSDSTRSRRGTAQE